MFILKCARLLGPIAVGSIFGVAICIIVNALLDSFVVGSVFGIVSYIIAYKFTKDIITEKIRKKCEKAFKAKIKKRKRKAVYVGIYEKRIKAEGNMLDRLKSIGKKAIKATAVLGACAVAGGAVASAAVCAAPLFIAGSAVPLIAGGVLGATVITLACIITKEIIAQKARKKFNEAFKAEIQEAKKNAVHVGIFDEEDNTIGEITIESEQGVDASIKQGDVIYLTYQEAKKNAVQEAKKNAVQVGIFDEEW